MNCSLYELQKVAQGPMFRLVMIGDQHLMLLQMDRLKAHPPNHLGPATRAGGMVPQPRMGMQVQERILVVVERQTGSHQLHPKAGTKGA